jgi:hypothetical protein
MDFFSALAAQGFWEHGILVSNTVLMWLKTTVLIQFTFSSNNSLFPRTIHFFLRTIHLFSEQFTFSCLSVGLMKPLNFFARLCYRVANLIVQAHLTSPGSLPPIDKMHPPRGIVKRQVRRIRDEKGRKKAANTSILR